jgi:hypothetical protein
LEHVVLKQTLKRVSILFAASVGVTTILALLLWWHHASIAEQCRPTWSVGESFTCYYRTTLFGDWPSVAMLAAAYLVACFFVVLLREWARRRFSR